MKRNAMAAHNHASQICRSKPCIHPERIRAFIELESRTAIQSAADYQNRTSMVLTGRVISRFEICIVSVSIEQSMMKEQEAYSANVLHVVKGTDCSAAGRIIGFQSRHDRRSTRGQQRRGKWCLHSMRGKLRTEAGDQTRTFSPGPTTYSG